MHMAGAKTTFCLCCVPTTKVLDAVEQGATTNRAFVSKRAMYMCQRAHLDDGVLRMSERLLHVELRQPSSKVPNHACHRSVVLQMVCSLQMWSLLAW